jgi:3-oxoacyl-[acyl-carrier protein] reductase
LTSAYPGSAILAGSKGALEAMTRVFANELGAKHIRVNVVSLGFTITEGSQVAVPGQEERIKSVLQRTPLGRVGQSEDIAKIVYFVASDDAGWITGTIVPAAGRPSLTQSPAKDRCKHRTVQLCSAPTL